MTLARSWPRHVVSKAFRKLVEHAPGVATFMSRSYGQWYFRRGQARRQELARNLAMAFPERTPQEIDELCSTFAKARYEMLTDQLRLDSLPPKELADYIRRTVTVVGGEHLDAALERPEPVVAFGPHYGNFSIATLALILRSTPRKSVGLFFNPPEKNPYAPRMSRLISSLESGAQILFNDRGGLMKAFRTLHKGGLIGIMPDVYDYGVGTIMVPFFGRFTFAMTGTAFLSSKYNATLLPLYCVRKGTDQYELQVDAPLPLSRTGEMEEDVWNTTAAIFANMERHLRAAPEHWMYWDLFHRRVHPAVQVPRTREELDTALVTLSRKVWARSPVGEFLHELAGKRSEPLSAKAALLEPEPQRPTGS